MIFLVILDELQGYKRFINSLPCTEWENKDRGNWHDIRREATSHKRGLEGKTKHVSSKILFFLQLYTFIYLVQYFVKGWKKFDEHYWIYFRLCLSVCFLSGRLSWV
jgi:hypothetical protein